MSRPGTSNNNSNQLALRDFEDDDENDSGLPPSRGGNVGGNFGSNNGNPGTPSSSRARMLAQQRELQLKKRQNNISGSGMIRSSVETATSAGNNSVNSSVTSLKQSTDGGQFTPAIRQFSAPKSVRSDSFHE